MSEHAVLPQESEGHSHPSAKHHADAHHSDANHDGSHPAGSNHSGTPHSKTEGHLPHHHAMSEKLKRLGFSNASHMRLYGEEFELLSDPIVIEDDVVFFDAIERKSRQPRRVRIPLTIVRMARTDRHAA